MDPRDRTSQSPVPSITLQITKKDAELFLEASHDLKAKFDVLKSEQDHRVENLLIGDQDKQISDIKTKPLHEMLFDAALQCQHPLIVEFLSRMTSLVEFAGGPTSADCSSRNKKEIQAAMLLFHDIDKTAKLRHLFAILSSAPCSALLENLSVEEEKKDDNPKSLGVTPPAPELNEQNAISLFRTVLMAISCCIQIPEDQGTCKKMKTTSESIVVVEGKPSEENVTVSSSKEHGPSKRPKTEHADDVTAKTKSETLDDDFGNSCQTPSFDSSLATLHDEDEKFSPLGNTSRTNQLHSEILEIARYAADELFQYANNQNQQHQKASEITPGHENLTVDFATFGDWYNSSGSKIVPWLELLQRSKWKPHSSRKESASHTKSKSAVSSANDSNSHALPPKSPPVSLKPPPTSSKQSESPMKFATCISSRTLVSFDFSGSGSPTPLLINISDDNLYALQALLRRTNLINCTTSYVCKALLQGGSQRTVNGIDCMILRKDDFKKVIRQIIPSATFNQLSSLEKECFEESFADFFSCFEGAKNWLQSEEVDLNEFTVGFCFFCAGNKSKKLLAGFNLLDSMGCGYLTEDQLSHYLRSYLTMLVAMSLLKPISKRHYRRALTPKRRKELRSAVESGAKWTLGHFIKASGQTKDEYTFECFANWYSQGGYSIAPWLELLDLKKVMSLIAEPGSPLDLPPLDNTNQESFQSAQPRTRTRDRVSSLRRHHSSRRGPAPEVLFTFPLGSRRSLVVLREDATYVRSVVEQLGLLTMKPDALWNALFKAVQRRRNPAPGGVAIYVDMATFVQCMKEVCPKPNRKRSAPGASGSSSSLEEILANFYQCFDIDQCDSVALDELMGGLTLLCGGKKSTKLAFAFSIFDTRPGINNAGKKDRVIHSLSGEDLFLFLRSILIVTFSTCRQSLDMTDEVVGRCIADTANMICNDVMRHQWETKQLDRLDFDEFGQWYNDGGFERAPWLELLDLNKWVLIDNFSNTLEKGAGSPEGHVSLLSQKHEPTRFSPPLPSPESAMHPPLPEEALDNSFLDEIDSMDEMDMILMHTSSVDRDDLKIAKSFSYSHSPRQLHPPASTDLQGVNPLKFHLVTTDEHGGYMLSLSPARISHFRSLLEATGLHNLEAETACNKILSKGSNSKLSKKSFDSAMKALLSASNSGKSLDEYSGKTMKGVFNSIFDAFDHEGTKEVNAIEVACGFTVLCRGKKSDKLEFAFEVLDKKKRGRLLRSDMSNYLQSFLTVLLSIAFSSSLDNDPSEDTLLTMSGSTCERSTAMLIQAVRSGAEWAAALAFSEFENDHPNQRVSMSFDDFASWYTRAGYSSIPWLELLDLQKWAMVPEAKM